MKLMTGYWVQETVNLAVDWLGRRMVLDPYTGVSYTEHETLQMLKRYPHLQR